MRLSIVSRVAIGISLAGLIALMGLPAYGDSSTPRKHRQQVLYEQAESARAEGNSEQAGKILAGMAEGYWSAVGYLNLASDYARNDLNPSRAIVALRVALAMADKDADAQRKTALRSRILLRAGYLAYTTSDYEKAIGFLEKVPLDSHNTPQALYFHGLALAEQGNHRAAMQSWHRAKKYPLAYPGVADAWIAMGRGYDLSGYLGQAGEAYLAANAAYESERVTLGKLADQIEEQGAYKALVLDARSSFSGFEESGSGRQKTEWFLADGRTLTQSRMAYLLGFMEQPSAQKAVSRVEGLAQMTDQLGGKVQDLDVYIAAITDQLDEPQGSSGNLKALLAEARALRKSSVAYLDSVSALRTQADALLDRLALEFVAVQDKRMMSALDKTEQQIAHLYEYLALKELDSGEQSR